MGDTRTIAHDQSVVLVKTRALRETALEAKVAFFARPRRAPACFRNPGRGAVIRLKNHLVSTLDPSPSRLLRRFQMLRRIPLNIWSGRIREGKRRRNARRHSCSSRRSRCWFLNFGSTSSPSNLQIGLVLKKRIRAPRLRRHTHRSRKSSHRRSLLGRPCPAMDFPVREQYRACGPRGHRSVPPKSE